MENIQKPIHVIARGVIIKDGKILLCINKKKSFYYLPGGHVEPGESAAVALERELAEELGVACSIIRFLGIFEYSFIPDNLHKCHFHEYNLVFLTTINDMKPETTPQSYEEEIAFEWVALDTLSQTNFKPIELLEPLNDWLQSDYASALVTSIQNK